MVQQIVYTGNDHVAITCVFNLGFEGSLFHTDQVLIETDGTLCFGVKIMRGGEIVASLRSAATS